ncbi:MAG: FAD-binding protein [Planctomycetota bacterium]|nr:FAD-binding protein [Planctomycetota bacterium]MDG2143285.1 FAD-binding protein [Planctomycetota bacterium]
MTLSIEWPCVALADAPLAHRTTLKVGGRAEWLLEPDNPDQLREAWLMAKEQGLDIRILGMGANLIIDDGTLPGVVISTQRVRRTFRPLEPGQTIQPDELSEEEAAKLLDIEAPAIAADDPRLIVWAGASLPGLVRAGNELGWSGLEGLIGVPGTLGGAIAMNAGGRWGDIWDVVDMVRVLRADGEFEDIARADGNPGYRNGGLGDSIVVGAVLRLELDNKLQVAERSKQYLLEKRAVQPVTESSAGCVFKNPGGAKAGNPNSKKISAGQLIDELGLKSLKRGPAQVSELHGNFIVNRGGATGSDVFGLIDDLKRAVQDMRGIDLEVEVKRWR